jgi:acyl-CoA thioester hydrolase
MPLTHKQTFQVRYYECDAYGHLNNANYLRYMQETAFEASAAAGYGLARYQAMDRFWLIRETEIEYLQPLRYGDLVHVVTWVDQFRRVSCRRLYEFHKDGGEDLAARAETLWIFLDNETNKPASIPDDLYLTFLPANDSMSAPARQAFPSAPPPPPGVFNTRRKVIWHDLDMVQHVNNAVYLEYVEECGMQVLAAHDWPVTRMTEKGFGIVIRRYQIQYQQPALLDDELEIATWAAHIKRSTAMRYYSICRQNDNALLAQIHAYGVWIDLATGRPIRIPKDFIAAFAPNIVPDE